MLQGGFEQGNMKGRDIASEMTEPTLIENTPGHSESGLVTLRFRA